MIDFVMDGRDVGQRSVITFFRKRSTRNAAIEMEDYCEGKKPECIEFERHCSLGCGTKLSIYNKQDVCFLCQEKMSILWKLKNWKWRDE
jgi:hypothetical protein